MSALTSWLCCGAINENDDCNIRGRGWRIFSLKEVVWATNNFSDKNKLGEGSFGSVYWGHLPDGSQVAVKRLKILNMKSEMEFVVEVEILGRVHHRNLLALRGYCIEKQERLIIYDFMQNLSLLSHLHGQFSAQAHLDWQRRMRIAVGSAEGLEYLHHCASPHIIHRDVKASNVLLDSKFEPLVADFGFAKLIPEGASHVITRVKGTLGYLAPEYALWGKASEICDVYSFGILLLELVTGKKPIEKISSGRTRTIVEWAAPFLSEGNVKELVDPKLEGKYDEDELIRVIEIATMCAQHDPEARPNMKEVVKLLKGEKMCRLSSSADDDNHVVTAIDAN